MCGEPKIGDRSLVENRTITIEAEVWVNELLIHEQKGWVEAKNKACGEAGS